MASTGQWVGFGFFTGAMTTVYTQQAIRLGARPGAAATQASLAAMRGGFRTAHMLQKAGVKLAPPTGRFLGRTGKVSVKIGVKIGRGVVGKALLGFAAVEAVKGAVQADRRGTFGEKAQQTFAGGVSGFTGISQSRVETLLFSSGTETPIQEVTSAQTFGGQRELTFADFS